MAFFARYDGTSGQIIAVGQADDPTIQDGNIYYDPLNPDVPIDSSVNYVDVSSVTLEARPLMSTVASWDHTTVVANGAAIVSFGSGLPSDATVDIIVPVGSGLENVFGIVETSGTFSLSTQVAGPYTVTIHAFPYTDSATVITALSAVTTVTTQSYNDPSVSSDLGPWGVGNIHQMSTQNYTFTGLGNPTVITAAIANMGSSVPSSTNTNMVNGETITLNIQMTLTNLTTSTQIYQNLKTNVYVASKSGGVLTETWTGGASSNVAINWSTTNTLDYGSQYQVTFEWYRTSTSGTPSTNIALQTSNRTCSFNAS